MFVFCVHRNDRTHRGSQGEGAAAAARISRWNASSMEEKAVLRKSSVWIRSRLDLKRVVRREALDEMSTPAAFSASTNLSSFLTFLRAVKVLER